MEQTIRDTYKQAANHITLSRTIFMRSRAESSLVCGPASLIVLSWVLVHPAILETSVSINHWALTTEYLQYTPLFHQHLWQRLLTVLQICLVPFLNPSRLYFIRCDQNTAFFSKGMCNSFHCAPFSMNFAIHQDILEGVCVADTTGPWMEQILSKVLGWLVVNTALCI